MLTGMDVFNPGRGAAPQRAAAPGGADAARESCASDGLHQHLRRVSAAIPARAGSTRTWTSTAGESGDEGRSPKAQNLNDVALPELDRLARAKEPFLLFLRHMDPHAPYLPPEPYERMFYHGNECDPKNKSMEPVMAFKPFRDFFASWMPPGITDKDYVIAQYDGAVAYMDAAIQTIFTALEARGILDETIVVINSDHGETLYDHDCYFDHHGHLRQHAARAAHHPLSAARCPRGSASRATTGTRT